MDLRKLRPNSARKNSKAKYKQNVQRLHSPKGKVGRSAKQTKFIEFV